MDATPEDMAALRAEVLSLRAEVLSLRAEIAALRSADKDAAVLAGLGTLSLAGGVGGGVPVPHDEDEEEDKDAESDDEGTLARLAATSPHLVDDGNPMWLGRKTDVYEVVINDDRSIKYDADGKFTIKKVGLFNFAYEAMYWVLKEKSGNGTLPPGWDESKGCGGCFRSLGGLFSKAKKSFQSQGYDAKVAKYGTLFPAKQVNEFKKWCVVYTTPEQYMLVKRAHNIESKTDFVNVLPAAIRN